MDINTLIAIRLRGLRDSCGLSLEALAKRSGVSRSNISLIERGESSPTAALLDKLAAALGVTLASLFEERQAASAAPSPLARAVDQPQWTDPASGYVRRNLSPSAPSPIQLVSASFPAGQRIVLDSPARENEIHQQIWVIEGTMEITIGDQLWRLEPGDCLAMRIEQHIVFHNPGSKTARYLVAIAAAATTPGRRTA
jgi:transcriptional regulator with XRE-family HTH domain